MVRKMEQKRPIRNAFTSLWYSYKSLIQQRNDNRPSDQPLNMDDWRSRLFTNFIIYLLPSCLLALVPGVYMSLAHGHWVMAAIDLLSLFFIIFISLSTKLSLHLKKILVILIFYGLSVMLMINLSILGPGLVYLLTLSVVVTLTCKIRLAYYSVGLNLAVCLACAALIHYKPFGTPLATDYSLGVWITVSSNMVFLSFIIVVLIGKTIQRLEKTILVEQQLKDDLQQANFALSNTNRLLRESEGHYRTLFFQNPTPMWVVDIQTLVFLQINQAAVLKYGYSKQEFLQMDISQIKTQFSAAKVRKIMQRAKKSGDPQIIYTPLTKKDPVFYRLKLYSIPSILTAVRLFWPSATTLPNEWLTSTQSIFSSKSFNKSLGSSRIRLEPP